MSHLSFQMVVMWEKWLVYVWGAASLSYFPSSIRCCKTFRPSAIADVMMLVLLTSTFVLSRNKLTVLLISLFRSSDKRIAIRQSFFLTHSVTSQHTNQYYHKVTHLSILHDVTSKILFVFITAVTKKELINMHLSTLLKFFSLTFFKHGADTGVGENF